MKFFDANIQKIIKFLFNCLVPAFWNSWLNDSGSLKNVSDFPVFIVSWYFDSRSFQKPFSKICKFLTPGVELENDSFIEWSGNRLFNSPGRGGEGRGERVSEITLFRRQMYSTSIHHAFIRISKFLMPRLWQSLLQIDYVLWAWNENRFVYRLIDEVWSFVFFGNK